MMKTSATNLAFVLLLQTLVAAPAIAQHSAPAQKAAALPHFPIRFEPAAEKGTFLARGIGAAVRLTGSSIDFSLAHEAERRDSIRVEFAGARRSSHLTGLDPLPGRVNYLFGDDPSRWRTNVRTYARAHTKNLYRGVDVLYYAANDRLEYDLVVWPGAHPEAIRLAIGGASVAISDAGDLVYGSDQRVLLHKPIAYQTVDGLRRDVAVAYRRNEEGEIGFTLGAYDRRQRLIIDPIVTYSFTFGGSGDEQAYDIAVDETGAVYVGGETYSNNFPTVNPAQLRQDAGDICNFYGIRTSICRDAFLAKLAADGTSLEYATYFVSTSFDQITHIAVDSSHALYFAGWTAIETISLEGDVRTSFIGKLAADGSHFLYTYISPPLPLGEQLIINDLAIGPDGSAYVVTSGPTTSDVAVLPPTGTNYHSIFTLTDPSGIRRTTFNSIAVRNNSVFVGGNTTWSGFQTTVGAAQRLFGGIRDGILMRMSLDGTVIHYSTFLGGAGSETLADVTVDQNGAVYAVGDMSDTDSSCSQSVDHVLVTKLTSDGSSVAYAKNFSYPFDSCFFAPTRIALDDRENVYTVGCGIGPIRMACNLWTVSPTGTTRALQDVPWYRFAIDATGTAKWFAPLSNEISLVKLVIRPGFISLIPSTPFSARFGTLLTWTADALAEADLEFSFSRYDPVYGWKETQTFGPNRSYSWTPAWWDVGDHQVCVFVRVVGSPEQPQSLCNAFTIGGVTPGEPPVLPSAADFNADLRPDLIWVNNASAKLGVWSLGGGAYGEAALSGVFLNAPSLPAGWRVAGSGDIDGDGHTDLVLQSDTGQVGAWMFNGTALRAGIFLTPSQVDPNWQIRAVGDLNHDGHPDLIWQHTTGQVGFWLMNGTTAIAYVNATPRPDPDWQIVGTGDSNRDGERDLFWQQSSTGALGVWLMNGTTFAAASLLSATPGTQWRAVVVSDLDGDAYSDIVLQNTISGDVGAWYLLGNALRFGRLLSPSSAPTWTLVGPK